MKVTIDKESWEAGFLAGFEGKENQCSNDLEGYSFASGYIEGKAARLPELAEYLAGAFSGGDKAAAVTKMECRYSIPTLASGLREWKAKTPNASKIYAVYTLISK